MRCKYKSLKNIKCNRDGRYIGYCTIHLKKFESGEIKVNNKIKELIDKDIFVMENKNEK